MPAFRETAMHFLYDAINSLHERMQQTNVLEFSHQDLLDMFVTRGDHETLLRIRHLTTETFANSHFKYYWRSGEGPGSFVELTFYMHDTDDKKHPAVPKHRDWMAANPEAVARVDAWLKQRWQLGVDYSRITRVLEVLNEICSSPQQVKFLWPSIVPLCKMNTSTRALASIMESARTPATIPTLSPELRQACRKTAGAIAVANLLGEPPDVTPEVTITCAGISVTEEGLGTWTSF
jgi:hypothetical protein